VRLRHILPTLPPVVLAATALAQQAKPTIVLAHGPFADAASWCGIIETDRG